LVGDSEMSPFDPKRTPATSRIGDATVAMGGAGFVIFAVMIAAQIFVAALGVVLDHQCRSGGGKEHCVFAAATARAQAATPAASQSPHH
jgi:hypothetical protein